MSKENQNPVREGNNVLVLTNTAHYWQGRVVGFDAFSILLSPATWIPDIGRHATVLATGEPDERTEIEPHPDGTVTSVPRVGSVVVDWPHDLWREQR